MDDYKRMALERNLEKAKSDTEKMLLLVMAMDEKDIEAAYQYLKVVVMKEATS